METIKLFFRLFKPRSIKFILVFTKNILYFGNYWPVYIRYLDSCSLGYVENPKVACTSVKSVLKQKANMRSSFTITSRTTEYYFFTVVRNPFSRLVSCYKNKILRGEWIYNRYLLGSLRYGLRQGMSFEDFVRKVAIIPDKYSDIHFRSQACIIKKINDYGTCKVLMLENINSEFGEISCKFGLGDLPNKNISHNQEEWVDYFTPELIDIVYNRYKKDFELWYPSAQLELINKIK
ncbi:MAG: sulfotransferase family 2 domain-containing protein [Cyclobacteriaceae bacterium]